MKESIKHLDCGKCNTKESIKYTVKDCKTYTETKVGKCENCKYQYGLKELWKQNQ